MNDKLILEYFHEIDTHGKIKYGHKDVQGNYKLIFCKFVRVNDR